MKYNKDLNDLLLGRKNKICVEDYNKEEIDKRGNNSLSDALISTMYINVASLGYALGDDICNYIRKADEVDSIKLYKCIVDSIQSNMPNKYAPLYEGFPTQVIENENLDAYGDAIKYIMSNGEIKPLVELMERKQYKVRFEKLIKLGLMDLKELIDTGFNIVHSKTSISSVDISILESVVNEALIKFKDLGDIEHRENKIIVYRAIYNKDKLQLRNILGKLDTATDVLRFINALSYGDITLRNRTMYKSLPRATRRAILGRLNELGYDKVLPDVIRYKEEWKRILERLHPFEYKNNEEINRAFKFIINKEKGFKSFNSVVEECISKRDYIGASKALSARPGELIRRLDHLVRECDVNDIAKILDVFEEVAKDIDSPVLLQARAHFKDRLMRDEIDTRVFNVKGKIYYTKNEVKHLDGIISERIIDICTNALEKIYSKRDKIGKVYIDPVMKEYAIPKSQRDASRAIKTIATGSSLKLDEDCKVLRAFIGWKQEEKSEEVDLDLSVMVLDENFEYVETVSFHNPNARGLNGHILHSGDVRTGRNGASEFIDIDIEGIRADVSCRGRYFIFGVYSYNSQVFTELPECFAGWMQRDDVGNVGEIMEYSTISNKIDMVSDNNASNIMILDLVDNRIVWMDKGYKSKYGCIDMEYNIDLTVAVAKDYIFRYRDNLYSLIEMNAKVRGEIVDNIEDADLVFSKDGDITPYDIEVFMAEYI